MRTVIVQRKINAVSETFLRAHATRLPNVAAVVHWQKGRPSINGHAASLSSRLHGAGRGLLRPPLCTAAYSDIFCELRPDVVLAQYGEVGIGVVEACRQMDIPLVVHFHGYDAWQKKFRNAYRPLFANASAVIAGSRSMANHLLGLGVPQAMLVVNYVSTIDTDVFKAHNPAANPPRYVAVGRMVEKKAPHLTLLSFARAIEKVPNATLSMVGDGPLMNRCRKIADQLNISHAVHFLGAKDHNTVVSELSKARAFVQHSVVAPNGDREGTSISVLEAAASGLPVVATRHEGIQETMIDGKTALLVDEKDVAGMSDRMVLLANSPGLASELGKNGTCRVHGLFTMEHTIRRLNAVLEAAASRQPILAVQDLIESELAEVQT